MRVVLRFTWTAVIAVAVSTLNVTTREVVAGTAVSPSGFEHMPGGDKSGGWPSVSQAQTIIHSAEFTNMPLGGAMLTEMNLRPDERAAVGDEFGFGRYQLAFSVTSTNPADMTRVFAENRDGETPATFVYDDEWFVTVINPVPADQGTRPFDYRAAFHTPFHYDPADGNLLVDWYFEDPLPTNGSQGQFDRSFRSDDQTTWWAGMPGNGRACCDFSVPIEIVFAIPGDFDGNDTLDANDIDLLSAAIKDVSTDTIYDVNQDGNIDQQDHSDWLKSLKNTWFGDADFNGEFNSTDFVKVFQVGKYETGQDASWGEGDWNGDGFFTSDDFVTSFQHGGYEKGPRVSVTAVPEPSSTALLLIGLTGLCRRRTRR